MDDTCALYGYRPPRAKGKLFRWSSGTGNPPRKQYQDDFNGQPGDSAANPIVIEDEPGDTAENLIVIY
ncbi:hypothetical protein CF335_g4751 [Tilletia laevis]|nr:hypothetical protein CF335_g4751 [Tilletia laevis]